MACFCDSCLQIKEGDCESSHVVQDWMATKVSFTRAWRDDPTNQHKEPVSFVSSAPVPPLSDDPSPAPALCAAPAPEPVCRKTFFDQLQNEMAAATSYADVHRIALRTADAVKNFPVATQPDLHVTAIPQGSIDSISLSLMPPRCPSTPFPCLGFGGWELLTTHTKHTGLWASRELCGNARENCS